MIRGRSKRRVTVACRRLAQQATLVCLILWMSGFILLMPPSLLAQFQQLRFSNFTIDDGLAHSKVNCIYQDREGFLWFGTNDGLNCFDGYSFTIFQQEPDNPHSLSANLIRCITEDEEGYLWIGTEGGGLNRYDRQFRTFKHFRADSSSEIMLSGNNVNAIYRDPAGQLWLGTEHGLDLFDPYQKRSIHFFPYPSDCKPASMNEILVIYEDSNRTLWLGTNGGGLLAFDRQHKVFQSYRKNDKPHGLGDDEIRSIYEDRYGNLWIGTTFGGLNLFDRKTAQFKHFYPDKNNPESTTIRAILDDDQGNLWIGNRAGLYYFDRKANRFLYYFHDPNNPYSLVHNSVQTIFRDAKGDLWIGTRGGISYLNMTNLPFVHIRAAANDPHCLNAQEVYAILEDRQGNLWFGTESGGLNFLDKKTGLFRYYMYEHHNPYSLSVNNIKALLEDRKGNIWIGTFNGGLNVLDRKNGKFKHFFHNPLDSLSLAIDNILALWEDDRGDIWIGTDGGGLDRFDRKGQRFFHILQKWHHQGFDNIHCLRIDQQGRLWMGANHGQIGYYHPQTKEFKAYILNSNLHNVEVKTLHIDSQGWLWCGTVGGGLYRFDPYQEKTLVWTTANGLPSNNIYGILQDSEGCLWFSTSKGLCRFDPNNGTLKTFFKENGLQSNQFHYNAYLRTRDGRMLFGGINGVTAFHPTAIRENTYLPPVVITNFTIFNKPVEIGGDQGILQRHISYTDKINLSYRHTVFSFEFVALNYAIPAQNQYAYKLEGFDSEWNYIGTRRFVTYTNLRPGEYTFRVKAANNDGLWNKQGASIHIHISRPFWQSLWFKMLLLAIFGLTVSHFIAYIRQRRDLLQARALANLAQLKLMRNQMNPHFLFNALGSIRSMILLDKQKAWDMVSELSEFLRYALLNFNKVEAVLDDEIVALQNYLHIEKVRYRDSLLVSFAIDNAAKSLTVPAFICQPLVENAIKYGMQTSRLPLKVNISISYKDDTLSIDVSNTGKLLSSPAAIDAHLDGHGNSLENIKQRLALMFKDRFSFQLFEEGEWVHAKIRMYYNRMPLPKA